MAADALPLDAQRASAFQAALLGMAGHDLRQPLQVIRGTYERLGARVRPESDQQLLKLGERAVERLTEQLDRLAGAIHLFEYTKHLDISRVELMPLFWKVFDENEHAARQKHVEIKVCPTDGRRQKQCRASQWHAPQPGRQCHQVHGAWRTRASGMPPPWFGCSYRRVRHRHRHRARTPAENLRSLQAAGRCAL